MKRLTFLILAISVIAPLTQAEPEKKAAASVNANAPKPAAAERAPLELKNKSSFKMEGNNRNPFWPIGWKPAAKLADNGIEHAGGDIPATAFVVSSITVQEGARFAIINGKIMQEGQQFGLQLGNQTYQITVKAIEDGRVTLARRDQDIVIPLRRK